MDASVRVMFQGLLSDESCPLHQAVKSKERGNGSDFSKREAVVLSLRVFIRTCGWAGGKKRAAAWHAGMG